MVPRGAGEGACAADWPTLSCPVSNPGPGAGSMPVVMVTASNASFPLGFSSQDIDTEWLPVADFVEKPVSMDVLAEKVASLLSKASEGR